MPPTPSRLELDGRRYEYLDVPAGHGGTRAPLLFLHEGLGSVGLWRGFPERIAAATGRRTVAYSRLGHGGSDPPPAPRAPPFLHKEATTTVPALCAALGLHRPVLVGHSDGASIALVHAARVHAAPVDVSGHPVTGLVVLAPHVLVEDLGLRSIAATRSRYERGDLRARMARHHRDPDAAFWNWCGVWLHPGFREWDIRPLLPRITCPVLAVQGDADEYGSLVHVEEIRDRVGGPVELLVLPGGHAPHLEHPEVVERALVAFLAGLP